MALDAQDRERIQTLIDHARITGGSAAGSMRSTGRWKGILLALPRPLRLETILF